MEGHKGANPFGTICYADLGGIHGNCTTDCTSTSSVSSTGPPCIYSITYAFGW
jgi:hypothetical protein